MLIFTHACATMENGERGKKSKKVPDHIKCINQGWLKKNEDERIKKKKPQLPKSNHIMCQT